MNAVSAQTKVPLYREQMGPCATYKVSNQHLFNMRFCCVRTNTNASLQRADGAMRYVSKYPINICVICNSIRCFRSNEDASQQKAHGPVRYVSYRWMHALQFVMQPNRVTHQTADPMPRAPGTVQEFAGWLSQTVLKPKTYGIEWALETTK